MGMGVLYLNYECESYPDQLGVSFANAAVRPVPLGPISSKQFDKKPGSTMLATKEYRGAGAADPWFNIENGPKGGSAHFLLAILSSLERFQDCGIMDCYR